MISILFDLFTTLSDRRLLHPCGDIQQAKHLAARYGGSPENWLKAYEQVQADWDSYYADLDLGDDDGIQQMWEGMLRTTRALFRLTATQEPSRDELAALLRELPYLMTHRCDTLLPNTKPILYLLHQSGYRLGVAAQVVQAQVKGILEGAGVWSLFDGPILTPDTTGYFRQDDAFFRPIGREPQSTWIVSSQQAILEVARRCGMQTVWLRRNQTSDLIPADVVLEGDLSGLFDRLPHRT